MSVAYLQLRESAAAALQRAYFDQQHECALQSSSASASAICIQRRWRGYRERKYMQFLHSCATSVQRVFRGHQGRLRFVRALRARDAAAARSFFDAQATLIQKLARGYLSRKFAQDVYKRRAYLATVTDRAQQLEQAMDSTLEQQLRDSDEARTQKRAIEFESLTQNLHHLVGTRAIPSVFQSRLGPAFDATAFDVPMEAHIREAFQNRQTKLRQMRTKVFSPNRTGVGSQQQFHATSASPSSSVLHSLPHSVVPSPPLSAAPSASASVRGSSASSRKSRPSSGARLAPLQTVTPVAQAVPAAAVSGQQPRASSSASHISATSSSLSAYPPRSPSHASSSSSLLGSTQKLPALRTASQNSAAGPPSGRTLDATQLHQSKISGLDGEEEKTQVPLALALGGHVSTTPTQSRRTAELSLAATRNAGSPATKARGKWTQTAKPQMQRAQV